MSFIHSSGFKYLKNLLIGVGAAIVMVGALFKLTHKPGADIFLTIGLLTEAAIFFIQGILPPHKDYYWEKVYPGLDQYSASAEGSTALTDDLNNALSKGNMNQDSIGRLGTHLEKLGANIDSLSSVVESAGASDEFSASARAAAQALNQVQASYTDAAAVAQNLTEATEGTKDYHNQVTAISKNLAALNAVYELELQDTNNHLKAMNTFYGNLTNAISNLNESLDDTKIYKEQMRELSSNLSSLNGIYGNMLSAMRQAAQ